MTSFHRRRARYAAGQHIRPNDPNQPEEEWTYPPTNTVLEAAGPVYDQFGKTSEADATVYVYSISFPNDTCIPAMFGIRYRHKRAPKSCLVIVTSEVLLRSALRESRVEARHRL
jgi:hypothetical protein